MVKFLHTADWHLGKKYTQLGLRADMAREIRLETIKNLFSIAENNNVDFVLVAGDLFDSNEVNLSWVYKLSEILSETQIHTYIIPGNHDPLTRDSLYYDPIWENIGNVTVLQKNKKFDISHNVALYPSPILQKQSIDDPTEWIKSEEDQISIGLAHGPLDIFDECTYFPINHNRAEISNLDYLALGEWHSLFTYPTNGVDRTVYAGTPETTNFKEKDSGKAVIVDIETPKATPVIQTIDVGKLEWKTVECPVNNLENIKKLNNDLKISAHPENVVMNLKLLGVLEQDSFDYLEKFQKNLEALFFYFNLNTDKLYLKPNLSEFMALIPEGAYLSKTFKALMALMKIDIKTNELSNISLEEAEVIFNNIKDLDSIAKANPEVLEKAFVLLYQFIKEVSS